MVLLAPIHHTVDGLVHAVAICLNLSLLFVIRSTENEKTKPFKNVFYLTCGSDLLCAIATFLSQPASFVNGDRAVMLSNGFFSQASPTVVLILLVAYNVAMVMNMALLPVPFVFRYFNMRDANSKLPLPGICIPPALLTIISVYTSYNYLRCDEQFQDEAARFVRSMPWATHVSEPRLFGFYVSLSDLRMMPHVVLVAVVNIAGYSIIVWSEICIFRKTRLSNKLMRESTRRLQSDLHRALIALAVCPIITSLIPVGSFVLALFFAFDLGPASPMLLIFVSFITVVNPITTCYFVRSFRHTFTKALCRRTPSSTPVSVVHFSQASL